MKMPGTSVRFEPEIRKKIIEKAKAEQRSINFVVNRLIAKALDEEVKKSRKKYTAIAE